MMRAVLKVLAIGFVTLALLPVQAILVGLGLRGARHIPVFYHRIVCTLLGVRIRKRNGMAQQRPLLIVSNHISWLDISVLSALAPVSFISKSDVASWPLFGLLAKLQRSVFVDRTRRFQTRLANREIAARLLAGDLVVLFAEGTSSDGQQVLPFRSALVGAVGEALLQSGDLTGIYIQPLSLAYVGEHGKRVAWFGDMDLLSHIGCVLRAGKIEAVVSWGEPVVYHGQSERKSLTKQLEFRVRSLLAGTIENTAIRQHNVPHPAQNAQGTAG